MARKQSRRCRRGFSLAELAITVLIIGILAAIAIPNYAESSSRFRAEAAAKRIAADLMYARQTALNEGAARQVAFTIDSNSYAMPDVPDPDRSSASYTVNLSSTAYPAVITDVDFDGSTSVTFDRFGQPNTSGDIIVEFDGYTEVIEVNHVTGRAVVQ